MLSMLDQSLLFSCIEILFGGRANNSTELAREFAHVDIKLSKLLCNLILDAMKQSWDEILDIDFEYIKTTKDHMLPNRIKSTDKIIVLQYSIKIDEVTSRLDICFPYSVLNSASQNSQQRRCEHTQC